MKLVRILCHSCDGDGFIEEVEYETNQLIKVLCPECEGKGWVEGQGYLNSEQTISREKEK